MTTVPCNHFPLGKNDAENKKIQVPLDFYFVSPDGNWT